MESFCHLNNAIVETVLLWRIEPLMNTDDAEPLFKEELQGFDWVTS